MQGGRHARMRTARHCWRRGRLPWAARLRRQIPVARHRRAGPRIPARGTAHVVRSRRDAWL